MAHEAAVVADTFSRTVVNGFGTPDVGGAWTVTGTTANWDVGSGVGTVLMAANSSNWYSYITANPIQDQVIEATFKLSDVPAGSTGAAVGLFGRFIDTSNYFRVRLNIFQGGISIQGHSNLGNLGDTYTGTQDWANDPDTEITLKAQFIGTSPTVIKAKAWLTAESEPDWMYVPPYDTATELTNASQPSLQTAGGYGLYFFNSSTATTTQTFTVDNYYAEPPTLNLSASGDGQPLGLSISVIDGGTTVPDILFTEDQLDYVKGLIALGSGDAYNKWQYILQGGGTRSSVTQGLRESGSVPSANRIFASLNYEVTGPTTNAAGATLTNCSSRATWANYVDDCVAVQTLAMRGWFEANPATGDLYLQKARDIWMHHVENLTHMSVMQSSGIDGDSEGSTGKIYVAWALSRGLPGVGILMRRPDIFTADDLTATQAWLKAVPCKGGLTTATLAGPNNLMGHTGNSNWQTGHINVGLMMSLIFQGADATAMKSYVDAYAQICLKGCYYHPLDSHHQHGVGYPPSTNWPGSPSSMTKQALGRTWGFDNVESPTPNTPTNSWWLGMSIDQGSDMGHRAMDASHTAAFAITYHHNYGDFADDYNLNGTNGGHERFIAVSESSADIQHEVIDRAWDSFNGDVHAATLGTTWNPVGTYPEGIDWVARNASTWAGTTYSQVTHPVDYVSGDSSNSGGIEATLFGWHYYYAHLKGIPMPRTRELCEITLGVAPRSRTNAAGAGILTQGYNYAWWDLMFPLDGIEVANPPVNVNLAIPAGEGRVERPQITITPVVNGAINTFLVGVGETLPLAIEIDNPAPLPADPVVKVSFDSGDGFTATVVFSNDEDDGWHTSVIEDPNPADNDE